MSDTLRVILNSQDNTRINDICDFLIENKDSIFENSTIERKLFGGIAASSVEFNNSNTPININKSDKYDLILTGFFIENILQMTKQNPNVLTDSPTVSKLIQKNTNYSKC